MTLVWKLKLLNMSILLASCKKTAIDFINKNDDHDSFKDSINILISEE